MCQLFGNSLERFGIKQCDRFRKRSERRATDTQLPANLIELADLLKSPQRINNRAEQPEQDQCAILVHMEAAVARLVTFRADAMQPLQQRPELSKVLQPLNVGRLKRRTAAIGFVV